MGKINDENYYIVHGWMINQLKLKGVPLQLYAIIYGFSQDGESRFTGSAQYLCDFTGTTKPTIHKALTELVSKGYIKKYDIEKNGIKFCEYSISLEVVKNFNRGDKEILQGGKETLQGGSKETLHNNEYIDNEVKMKIEIIIGHLNEKANTHYKTTTPKTISLLKALIEKQHFEVSDIITVIDKKCAEWLGTQWEKFLRPETLFGSKFESYLNAKNNPNVGTWNGAQQQQRIPTADDYDEDAFYNM